MCCRSEKVGGRKSRVKLKPIKAFSQADCVGRKNLRHFVIFLKGTVKLIILSINKAYFTTHKLFKNI